MATSAVPTHSAPVAAPSATRGLQPNLTGLIAQPLRYKPVDGDFVIEDGQEFFNRSLYGGNTAFRVDGGDKPEFVMYLPGRGGNLRLGIKTSIGMKWLKDADHIVMRYRPGELIYEVRDRTLGPKGVLTVEVLSLYRTEGMIVRITAKRIASGAELIWAYGGVNGQRGARDGDIGTEKVPIGQYFQLQPEFADGNRVTLNAQGFMVNSTAAAIAAVTPVGAHQQVGDADHWNEPARLFTLSETKPSRPLALGSAPLRNGHPLLLSLQRMADNKVPAQDLSTYSEVSKPRPGDTPMPAPPPLLPVFKRSQLSDAFHDTRHHFDGLRSRVRIETPDPYLDTAMGSLNVVTDALWDTSAQGIMHGSIAWRTKLLGWRGPYALDALGWHDRARQNIDTWVPRQNTSAIAPIPTADPTANLARNEPGLHSNGDISNSHYDMNIVFIDALFRHLLWTGDIAYARKVWPVIQRHIAWEQRLFRREYGPEKLPLYEAYATLWASDDLYYGGSGTAHASAYNAYANRMAARIAVLAGEDATPYTREADLIEKAMRTLLWLPEAGAFGESKDLLGLQRVHADYGLWSFYHTVDEQVVTPREAWAMGAALKTHMRPIPVIGPGVPQDQPYHVLSETDWMPYTWSINNVVMGENMHTALALWQGGHADEAYVLAKGALLASMFMGISPGNVGSMNYLDAYRRESQRDFGDSAGTMSRALIEGLFGIRPDALAGTLKIAPGFPSGWTHARLTHPDVGLNFVRNSMTDQWDISQSGTRFKTVTLRIPAAFSNVISVTVNGVKAQWTVDEDAVGRPMLEITAKATLATSIRIKWTGEAMTDQVMAMATRGKSDGDFYQMMHGTFTWWAMTPKASPAEIVTAPFDWNAPKTGAKFNQVNLTSVFNDKVSAIFASGKYLTPRAPGVSLSLPSQGIGAWAGHLNLLPVIDDMGLRKVAGQNANALIMPNGVRFSTPGEAGVRNIAFTSQWDNYPRDITVALDGRATYAYLLMAGSTNAMQSRLDNGEVVVSYTDGTTSRLALKNPDTWWPIEQDYFIDDYQFPNPAPLPPRVDLRTGAVRLLDPATFKGKGRDVPGGAASVLGLALDPTKPLRSLTLRTLSNDVVIGLMSVTLERP